MRVQLICVVFTLIFTTLPAFCQIINGSFENEQGEFSLEGWQNLGGLAQVETIPGGGNWSLELSGGCVFTSCRQAIPDVINGDIWKLSFWARSITVNGGGHFRWSNGQFTNTFIDDTLWTYISHIDTFQLAEGDTLKLIFEGGGGIVGFGGIYIDLVEMQKLGSTDVENNWTEIVPKKCKLRQNYPNPFNNTTTIGFSLPKTSMVIIEIYNAKGQFMEEVFRGVKQGGYHTVRWDASHQASGIYLINLKTDEFVTIKKCILAK